MLHPLQPPPTVLLELHTLVVMLQMSKPSCPVLPCEISSSLVTPKDRSVSRSMRCSDLLISSQFSARCCSSTLRDTDRAALLETIYCSTLRTQTGQLRNHLLQHSEGHRQCSFVRNHLLQHSEGHRQGSFVTNHLLQHSEDTDTAVLLEALYCSSPRTQTWQLCQKPFIAPLDTAALL